MAITLLQPFNFDSSKDYTFANVTVTTNIQSGNANLGNAATANYFIGNGAFLTGLPASYSNTNVASYLPTFTGDISAGNANLGNLATANYFTGTLTTATQPNITSIGSLTGLTVSNTAGIVNFATTANVTLGAVSNLHISGGTSGYVLQTDGTGNLSWTAQTGGGGGGSPGGANTQLQFNDAGVFGGSAALTFDKATNAMALTGNLTVTNANITSNISIGSGTGGNITGANIISANYFIGAGNALSNITAANITGTVANANYAAYAAEVTDASQPNITSVGTLTSLAVTGNANVGNLNATTDIFAGGNITATGNIVGGSGTGGSISGANLVSANYFSGSGNLLSNIQAGNITGTVANANYSLYAGTVLTASQPNITSVGTLSSLTVTANLSAGNVSGGNLVSATYISGNGSLLTAITGANVTGTVANATYATTAGTAYLVSGSNVSGDVSGANHANVADSANTVAGANVSGTVSSATTAATVTTNAQPNITSVGTLSSLSVTANANVGNLNSSGQVNGVDAIFTGNLTVQGNTTYINVETFRVEDPVIELGGGANGATLSTNDGKDRGTLLHYYTTAPVDAFMGWDNSNAEFAFGSNVSVSSDVVTFNNLGNVRAGYFIGDGSLLTGLPATYANANVANYLPTYTGNITAAYFIGNGSALTSITGANVTGFVPNADVSNTAYAVAGANVSGTVANATYATSAGSATTAGTVTTAAQPNITSFGTLTGLNSNGTVNFSNSTNVSLGSVSTIHISGGTSGYVLQTDGTGNLTWTAQTGGGGGSVAGANTEVQYNNAGAFGGSAAFTFNNVSNTLTSENITASGNISGANANLGNLVTANYFVGTFYGTANSAGNATTAGTVTTSAQPNITSVGTLSSLTISGLVTATATGIKVANIQDSTGTITIATRYNSVTGAVGIYKDLTVGTSGTGNLTVNGNSTLGSNANVFITGGSPDYVLATDGDGNLSWVAQSGGGGGGGSSIANGTSNVKIATSGGNITMSVAGNANVVTVTGSGIVISGNTSLGSNTNVAITGGTSGQVLATNGDGTLYWTTAGSAVVYQLDDLSNYTDGVLNTFMLAYNQTIVPISDPFGILVTINGAVQPAFVWNTDVVWQSFTLPAYKGYTIIDAGYLTFTDPPPAGAEIMVRTVTGVTNTNIRRYPFIAGDIMLG